MTPLEGPWIQLPQPRIMPGEGRDLAPFVRLIMPLISRSAGGRGVNLFSTLGRNRRVARAYFCFSARLMPFGTLSRRDTELVILRVAYNCRSGYEWRQHVDIADLVGMSAEEIERIKTGPEDPAWDLRDRAILNAVDDLHREKMISDQHWSALAEHFDPPRLMELCLLAGQYSMLAGMLNSIGVQLEDAVEGPREAVSGWLRSAVARRRSTLE